jgi:hypothetical protein
VTEPVSSFNDIAILWRRATVRCVLTGDGAACVLVLRDGPKPLKSTLVPDEETAFALSREWLRNHEAGLGPGPSLPKRARP